MKIKNKNSFTLLAAMALAACASDGPPSGSVRAGKPPKYIAPVQSQYGEWYIEPTTCTIRARAAEFTLQASGRPDRGTLSVKALFISPLVQPPVAEVSEILAPVPVEGTKRGYNIILAYDATNAAHMMKQDTYLIVRYQPLNSSVVLESSFNTRGLMFALADLANYCQP